MRLSFIGKVAANFCLMSCAASASMPSPNLNVRLGEVCLALSRSQSGLELSVIPDEVQISVRHEAIIGSSAGGSEVLFEGVGRLELSYRPANDIQCLGAPSSPTWSADRDGNPSFRTCLRPLANPDMGGLMVDASVRYNSEVRPFYIERHILAIAHCSTSREPAGIFQNDRVVIRGYTLVR